MKRLVFASLLTVLFGAVGCVGYRSASAPVYSGYNNYSYGYYDDCYYYGGCYGLYGYGPYGYGYGYGFFGFGNGVGVVGHTPLPGRGHRPHPRSTQSQLASLAPRNPGRVHAASSHSSGHSSAGHSSSGGHSGGGGGHGGGGGGHGGGGHH